MGSVDSLLTFHFFQMEETIFRFLKALTFTEPAMLPWGGKPPNGGDGQFMLRLNWVIQKANQTSRASSIVPNVLQ